jgi:hypothetical protein
LYFSKAFAVPYGRSVIRYSAAERLCSLGGTPPRSGDAYGHSIVLNSLNGSSRRPASSISTFRPALAS